MVSATRTTAMVSATQATAMAFATRATVPATSDDRSALLDSGAGLPGRDMEVASGKQLFLPRCEQAGAPGNRAGRPKSNKSRA